MSYHRFIFATIVLAILGLGIREMLFNLEENMCEMTYMWQYPQYLPIALPSNVTEEFPKYKLFIYAEGEYAVEIQQRNFLLSGIPVLFIPGNAGSYRQVRSLGSVALRMVESLRHSSHFNFFSVDLNEEFSGLSGSTVLDQVQFVESCITTILKLYPNNASRIVLIGHSMGGVVAAALYSRKSFNSDVSNLLITFATPHQAPVIELDRMLNSLYNDIKTKFDEFGIANKLQIFSIGGGTRDVLVHSRATVPPAVTSSHHVLTSAVPATWASTDHLCSVWCRQIIVATIRSLVQMINMQSKWEIIDNFSERRKIWRSHFDHGHGTTVKEFLTTSSPTFSQLLFKNAQTQLINLPQYYFSKKGTKFFNLFIPLHSEILVNFHYLIITSNIHHDSKYGNHVVVGTFLCYDKVSSDDNNLVVSGENVARNIATEKCTKAISITSLTTLLPPRYSKRNYIWLNASELRQLGVQSVIVRTQLVKKYNTTIGLEWLGDKSFQDERCFHVSSPSLTDFFHDENEFIITSYLRALYYLLFGRQIISNTNYGELYYEIFFRNFISPVWTFTVDISSYNCQRRKLTKSPEKFIGASIYWRTPWYSEELFRSISLGGNLSMNFQILMTPTDELIKLHEDEHPSLRVILHPQCRYNLHLRVNYMATIAQYIRSFGIYLPAFIVANILMVFVYQVKFMSFDVYVPKETKSSSSDDTSKHVNNGDNVESSIDSNGVYYDMLPPFYESHYRYGQPYRSVIVVNVLTILIYTVPYLYDWWHALGLPDDDSLPLRSKNLWIGFLPLQLYLIGWCFVQIQAALLHIFLTFAALVLSISLYRVMEAARSMGRVICYIQLLPLFFAAYAAYEYCGAGAFFICYVLTFLRLILYRVVVMKGGDLHTRSQFHLTFTVFLLYLSQMALAAPTLMAWLKQIPFTYTLSNDPTRVTALASVIALALHILVTDESLWVAYLPKNIITDHRWLFCILGFVIHGATIFIVGFAYRSLYRLPEVLAFILVCFSITQTVHRSTICQVDEESRSSSSDTAIDADFVNSKKKQNRYHVKNKHFSGNSHILTGGGGASESKGSKIRHRKHSHK